MTKRVLHVIPSVGPLRGGPSVMVRQLAGALAARGMNVHVATTDDNGPDRMAVRLGAPCVEQDVTYWYFPRQTRFYTFSWPLARWLASNTSQFDLVHIHALFSWAAVAAAFCARWHRVPYVVRPLGTLNEWGMAHRRPWLKRLSFNLLERHVLRHAAAVHFTSDQERVEAAKLNVTVRPAVIPNALPAVAESSAKGRFLTTHPGLAGKKIILFLSRIDEKKGLELLLEAFAFVRSGRDDVSLVVAGDGDPALVQRLHALATSLGIDADVLWAGFLRGAEKAAVLADSDLFVLPSYSENFGIAVAEAMAAGLPVVVSDNVGIHDEISRSRAGIVVHCDAAEIAAAISRLLDDGPVRRAMAEDARTLAAENYSESAVTRQIVAVYDSLVA